MEMQLIESFKIDHTRLLRGIYVSRKDSVGGSVVTTFDIRMKAPNKVPVMNMPEMHTIEHLGATFLRNHPKWKDKIVYFGPMGCQTGFYLLLSGDYNSTFLVDLMVEMFEFIAEYQGDVPGMKPIECGNCLSQNLSMAVYEAKKYLNEVLLNISESNLIYPK